MSLTVQDLSQIRAVIREEIEPIKSEIQALRNDIKEIYDMIEELRDTGISDKEFQKLSQEEKLLKINAELLTVARHAGIELPR